MIKNVQSKIHERKEERKTFDADGAGEDGGDFTDVLLQFRAWQIHADARRMEAIARALGCSVKDLILEE